MSKLFFSVSMSLDGFIRIAGGANVILEYLNAGLVDEVCLAVSPILLGEGTRLFDGIDQTKNELTIVEALHSPLVTQLRYAVTPR